MPKVRGMDAVMIYASDPAALSRWYADALGIHTERNPADGRFYGDVVDEAGREVHFGIYSAEKGAAGGARSVMINYRVDDIDAAVRQLEAMEVKITERVDESYGRFAYFQDPEGNPIEIWVKGKE